MSSETLTRREFIKLQLASGVCLSMGGLTGLACNRKKGRETSTRMIVLGMDGMDPHLVHRMMREGKLPNFTRLAREGSFGALCTSTPPQSPVAWSNFIVGTDPGGHGIFDFIHRDPATYLPYLSTSRTAPPSRHITLGNYVIPLSGGRVEDLRRGKAFWEILEEHEIPATVFKMPSNFPPTPTRQRTFAGMGTPDILGTYGIFSYYTDQPVEIDQEIGGARVVMVSAQDNRVQSEIRGPKNTYTTGSPDSSVGFTVWIDAVQPVAEIAIQDTEIILKQGEWSPWVQVQFRMMPTVKVRGICRFYLKEVRPHFRLYVTPVNIDPSDPALPLSTPQGYAKELYRHFGPFSTKGLPADTKAMDHGVLDEGEFLAQDDLVLEEDLAIYEYELDRFETGLLYHYISSTDQRSHMFWRLMDPHHPNFDARLASQYGDTIEKIYIEMDRLLERTWRKVDKRTILIALSDHGFVPYYRSFHLNTWLRDNGYLVISDKGTQGEGEFFGNVDWSRTRAYALGFNGLYINQRGREGMGVVSPLETQVLIEDIAKRLPTVTDPQNGACPVLRVYKARECYYGPYRDQGPDIIVGYNRAYRASWQTALGNTPAQMFETNMKKWSGDHCMASDILPGILLTNRKVVKPDPCLYDLTATILACFGIPIPKDMKGATVL